MNRIPVIISCALLFITVNVSAQINESTELKPRIDSNEAMLRLLGITKLDTPPKRRIKIAVIDMGFRLSHKTLGKYVFLNTGEIAGNMLDDDRNGYVDDIRGWDVADEDADVSVPNDRADQFYHGTYVASIIISVLETLWGDQAAGYIELIPIKIVSDNNPRLQLENSIKGLAYAKAMNPDIVCCAWTGGKMNEQESAIMRSMISNQSIVVAAVGNYMTEQVPQPASFPGVIAVASTDDKGQIANLTNYGKRVDLSAPGTNVYGAHPIADNAFLRERGSSPSTAFVAGIAAALKLCAHDEEVSTIREALINTAHPIGYINPSYAGKLGAGIPDFKAALAYLKHPENRHQWHDPKRTKGWLQTSNSKPPYRWMIVPDGGIRGLILQSSLADEKARVKIIADDSVYFNGNSRELFAGLTIPGQQFEVEYSPAKRKSLTNAFYYQIESIDSSKLHCKGKVTLQINASGIIEDGSGLSDYTNRCDCQWQIIAPEGKRISIEIEWLETEQDSDILYLFDGEYTMPESLLEKLSGNVSRKTIVSRSNKMLVWFVSGKTVTGKGWKLRYAVID